MIGKVKGYPVSVVMPESATPERVELLRMYGANIIFSPGNLGSNGAVAKARPMAEADPVAVHAVPVRQRGQSRRALLRHRRSRSSTRYPTAASTRSWPASVPAAR